jgi:AraC family transcriptional regulator
LSVEREGGAGYDNALALDPFSSLQRSVFMSGRAFSYFADTPGLPLSLKCMSNGRALYKFGRAEVAVDDGGYLILNDGQPYSIEIASPTSVETFVLWFPRGWAEEVCSSFNETSETLLDKSPDENGANAAFFERYTPHDRVVSPKVRALRAAFKGKQTIEDGWLEEKLRELLAAMLASQNALNREVSTLPAVRASTREELWRRVNLGRDYLHARLAAPISLSEVAAVACLSPFHFLRVFQSAFGQTPHQYLNHCRIERAKFLLEKTTIPVTAICLECGFTSLGSFSALFHKHCGFSPREWRKGHGVRADENSNIREVFLTGRDVGSRS